MAERDFTTLLEPSALVASPARLAAVPVRIWEQRFRNAGVARSERGDNNFRFTIEGFPEMHRMLCETLTGYGEAVGRNKVSSSTNTHDQCVHRGDKVCSWLTTW